MTAIREAIVLPAVFLTVALVGGVGFGTRTALSPPSLFSLVLATLLVGTLVRCGALAPARLLHGSRGVLENANGFVALSTLFLASAQVTAMLTPRSGLPAVFVDVFLFVLVLNTWVALPDATRVLRSLAVTLGSALVLKFVILAGLSEPSGRSARIFTLLFDVATLGSVVQEREPAVAGYAAFAAVVLFLTGIALLPRQPGRLVNETSLVPR